MASSEDFESPPAKFQKRDFSDADKAFSCSICLTFYSNPRILPNCGHSFCLTCLENVHRNSVDKTRIDCPECRTSSFIGTTASVTNLKVNVQLLRAVELFKSAIADDVVTFKPSSQNRISYHDTCPHSFVTKSPVKCSHCNKEFCNSCQFRHMEQMKVEILSIGGQFSERVNAASSNLDEKLTSLRSSLDVEVASMTSQVECYFDDLEENVLKKIREARENLLREVLTVGRHAFENVKRVVKAAQGDKDNLGSAVADLASRSVLSYKSLDEVAQLRLRVNGRSDEISEIESLKLTGKMLLDDMDLKDKITSAVNSLNSEMVLSWLSPDEFEYEQLMVIARRLHSTSKRGDLEFIQQQLLSENLNPYDRAMLLEHEDVADADRTILLQAVMNGHLAVVEFLVRDQKANIDARDDNKRSMAIHLAVRESCFDIVEFLLRTNPLLIDAVECFRRTPLHVAAICGEIGIAKLLVNEFSADVERKDEKGRTPLVLATHNGSLEIVQFLIERGANAHVKDMTHFDGTLLHIAAYHGWDNLVTFLYDHYQKFAQMKNKLGKTPLGIAAEQGEEKVYKFLVEKGAPL